MTTPLTFTTLFPQPKSILAMLHLGGEDEAARLRRAQIEIEQLVEGGVDAVIVENYFGSNDDVQAVLSWLDANPLPVPVGLNVLRNHHLAFELAKKHPVAFIQMDSVAGHFAADEDSPFAAELESLRRDSDALLFGGVRFKYQPVNSGLTEEEDVIRGAARADALVVTGEGTGIETDVAKVERFRAVVGGAYPLIVGAGLTASNAAVQLASADAAIVGSYFKDTYTDTGVVDPAHVAELMTAVKAVRASAAGN